MNVSTKYEGIISDIEAHKERGGTILIKSTLENGVEVSTTDLRVHTINWKHGDIKTTRHKWSDVAIDKYETMVFGSEEDPNPMIRANDIVDAFVQHIELVEDRAEDHDTKIEYINPNGSKPPVGMKPSRELFLKRTMSGLSK